MNETTSQDKTVTERDLPPEVREELWINTFGTNGESFEWWTRVRFESGDWDTIGVVTLTITDPDDEDKAITKTVNYADIEAAALKVMTTSVDACTGQAITIGMDMDWDACVSDCVLQTAVLGEVVYG